MATESKQEGYGAEGAKVTYDRLTNTRNAYITRANDCATYTIPSLFPKEADNEGTNYPTPYQSIGARGLNNLAAKIMLALFPVGIPFFRLNVSELEIKQISDDTQALQQVEQGLTMVERIVLRFMEANSYRPVLYDAVRQLLVSGNALIYLPRAESKDTPMAPKLYKLLFYTIERDAYDNVLNIVTKDRIAIGALPEDILSAVKASQGEDLELSQEIDVYTHIYRDNESEVFKSYQEVEGEIVKGTEGEYPLDALPWIPIRLIKMAGEDYGRSYAEEYLGDLKSLENLYKSIVQMAMISSKILWLVNPNGMTRPRKIAKAESGDFVAGRPDDITALQLEKSNDFQVAKLTANDIETRLSFAFMLNSAVQRGGERVTAEEIRYVAGELQDTLGGVYSLLAQELQLPLARVLLKELQATKKIPQLPKEAVEPSISTGLEALGRGHDLTRLETFITMVANLNQLQDPDINMQNMKLRIANALGVDIEGLLLTEEDRQQQAQQQASETALQSGAAEGGAVAGGMAAQAGTEQQMAAAQEQAQQ